jgi:RNA recognition motif-containing protein
MAGRNSTVTGKQSGGANIDKCTCFVRRVQQDVKEEDLLELFGAIGPVKNAFIVQEKDDAKHKGYAFVTFALADDAKKAVQQLANHNLKGSRLQVSATHILPC